MRNARTAGARVLGLAAPGFLAVTAALGAELPPAPATSSDPAACDWRWVEGGGLGLWSERCAFDTGDWRVEFRRDLPGFVLMRDDEDLQVVAQPFRKPAAAPVAAILPELRARGYVPDDAECVFEPAAIRAAPRTVTFFEIRPIGSRLRALDETPPDEVPDPPCGAYGWSTHGVRYFVSDLRTPEVVVYVDVGQDGAFIDPATITVQ